jgi:hypothetical protein
VGGSSPSAKHSSGSFAESSTVLRQLTGGELGDVFGQHKAKIRLASRHERSRPGDETR